MEKGYNIKGKCLSKLEDIQMHENTQGEIQALAFDEDTYDLDGIIRMADSEHAAFIFTFEDEDDDRYYMNRYDVLECTEGVDRMLRRIHHYLESDEANGLFVSFAVAYEGRLNILDGQSVPVDEMDLGELELGENVIYGMLIRKRDEAILFDEMVYIDGAGKSHSWAEAVIDGGELTHLMKRMIQQFS